MTKKVSLYDLCADILKGARPELSTTPQPVDNFLQQVVKVHPCPPPRPDQVPDYELGHSGIFANLSPDCDLIRCYYCEHWRAHRGTCMAGGGRGNHPFMPHRCMVDSFTLRELDDAEL